MSAREVYDFVKDRLDSDYVEQTARFVADALRETLPIGVAFQPGDGTRYDLVFLPTQALAHAPGRVVRGDRWSELTDFGVSRVPGTALVSWYKHGAVGLDLRSGGFEPAYVADLFQPEPTFASACTLTILFEAVAGAFAAASALEATDG